MDQELTFGSRVDLLNCWKAKEKKMKEKEKATRVAVAWN